jgi:hypothetical protein
MVRERGSPRCLPPTPLPGANVPLRPASLAALTLMLAAACVTVPTSLKVSDEAYRQYTAGAIGCPADELVLSGQRNEVRLGEVPPAYRAECRGRRFVCSAAADRAVCTEELASAAPRSVTP